MPQLRRTLLLGAVLALCAPWLAAQTTEVAGVKYPPSVQIAGSALQLNGAGIRYKAIFKVYTAALYLTARTSTPEPVFAPPSARRLHITMLRDIDANELGKLFTRGMQDNAPREEFAKSINGTIKMGEMFAARKKLAAGDWFTIDWVPGSGTVITVNGKQAMEPVKEPEFYSALMRIWLGQRPADAQLKDALLGKTAARVGAGES